MIFIPSPCVIWNVDLLVICLEDDEQDSEDDYDADDDNHDHGT